MNAHLSDMDLDDIVAGQRLHPKHDDHLARCAHCRTRLSRMADAEVELLLAGAAAFNQAPSLAYEEEVEHSQVRYIDALRGANTQAATSLWSRHQPSQRFVRVRQVLASCAMVMALTVSGYISHPPPQSSSLELGYTAWLTAGCHASQPWCSYRAN